LDEYGKNASEVLPALRGAFYDEGYAFAKLIDVDAAGRTLPRAESSDASVGDDSGGLEKGASSVVPAAIVNPPSAPEGAPRMNPPNASDGALRVNPLQMLAPLSASGGFLPPLDLGDAFLDSPSRAATAADMMVARVAASEREEGEVNDRELRKSEGVTGGCDADVRDGLVESESTSDRLSAESPAPLSNVPRPEADGGGPWEQPRSPASSQPADLYDVFELISKVALGGKCLLVLLS
jgi:hypothetical protein